MHDRRGVQLGVLRVGQSCPARQRRTIRLQVLPDDLQTEVVKAAERGQVRAREGSVRHVEVLLVEA